MKALGIDIGSLNVKAVILDGSGPLASIRCRGGRSGSSRQTAMEEVIKKAGLTPDGWYIVATGVGGKAVTFSQQQKAITTCLARGVHLLFPTARMVIDLGAETSTVLKINDRGTGDGLGRAG